MVQPGTISGPYRAYIGITDGMPIARGMGVPVPEMTAFLDSSSIVTSRAQSCRVLGIADGMVRAGPGPPRRGTFSAVPAAHTAMALMYGLWPRRTSVARRLWRHISHGNILVMATY